MKRGISQFSAVLAALAATGCCHYGRSARHAAPAPVPAALAAPFSYPKQTNCPSLEREIALKPGYAVKRVELQIPSESSGTNRVIEFDFYKPASSGPRPVLLVLPVMGGKHYDLEEIFARYFARHGLAAIILRRERWSETQGIAVIDPMLRQTVIDNKHVIDWIETRPELDATRIGVFGASMGGIKGVLLAALDDRVRASVLGLAGGDLPYVLAQTTEPGVKRQRERLLRSEHLTLDEFQARLKQSITCDPLAFAPYIDPDKVLMFVALFDTVVPNTRGRELRAKMGNPEMVLLPTGHYTAALCIPYIENQSLKFFQRKLGGVTGDARRSITLDGPAFQQRSNGVTAITSGGAPPASHARDR
jgi:hypothetical protein